MQQMESRWTLLASTTGTNLVDQAAGLKAGPMVAMKGDLTATSTAARLTETLMTHLVNKWV